MSLVYPELIFGWILTKNLLKKNPNRQVHLIWMKWLFDNNIARKRDLMEESLGLPCVQTHSGINCVYDVDRKKNKYTRVIATNRMNSMSIQRCCIKMISIFFFIHFGVNDQQQFPLEIKYSYSNYDLVLNKLCVIILFQHFWALNHVCLSSQRIFSLWSHLQQYYWILVLDQRSRRDSIYVSIDKKKSKTNEKKKNETKSQRE